uniref:Uncharacterized protein n=1 Tax=Oryza punctata TaxID=4537 RepID=A0A0E0KFS6_ORYPU
MANSGGIWKEKGRNNARVFEAVPCSPAGVTATATATIIEEWWTWRKVIYISTIQHSRLSRKATRCNIRTSFR